MEALPAAVTMATPAMYDARRWCAACRLARRAGATRCGAAATWTLLYNAANVAANVTECVSGPALPAPRAQAAVGAGKWGAGPFVR